MSKPEQRHYPILETIDSPDELRALNENQLPHLADELREFLIQSVANTGGHLSAGLGTIELTLALHYVYNTPQDKLVWDVGHQTYPHKIITGRRQQMKTMRQHHGLAGFPKREESPYDTFGVGHSSTSISAALGMSIAAASRYPPMWAACRSIWPKYCRVKFTPPYAAAVRKYCNICRICGNWPNAPKNI